MGMYTEVVFRAEINEEELGKDIFDIFDYMFNPDTNVERYDLILPKHEFFKCQRWDSVGNMSSFYHHPNRVVDWYIPYYNNMDKKYPDVHIFSRNDLKDYDEEIREFFDWVDSLGIFREGEYMGYSLYEEDNTPTIYNSKGK